MPRTPALLTATLLLVCACAEESRHSGRSTPQEADGEAAEAADDASTSEAQPEAAAGPSLPEAPERFRVEFSASSCLGTCPAYSVSVDQAGQVEFRGTHCVARPGKYQRQVSAADARAVYDALSATEFGRLGDRYVSEADGCEVLTDAPTSNWRVSTEAFEKRLEHYHGCLGVEVDALQAVDAIRPLLHESTDVLRYLEPNPNDCLFGGRAPVTSLRLSKDGKPFALLELLQTLPMLPAVAAFPSRFELRDCAGNVLAQGVPRTDGPRLVLLQDTLAPITLADFGSFASIVAEPLGDSPFAPALTPTHARALREEGDFDFELEPGNACP